MAIALSTLLLVAVPGVWGWQQVQRNRDLERLNDQLGKQVVAEQVARARAERNSERARRAVMHFLDAVGAVALADVPGAEVLRRDLLDRAASIHEELFAETPTPAIRNELAKILARLATRDEELGNADSARERHERSLALFDAPDALPTTTIEDRRARAIALGEQAGWFLMHHDPAMNAALRRNVAEWRALLAEHDDAPTRLDVATSLAYLAADVEVEEAQLLVDEALALLPEVAGELDVRTELKMTHALSSLAAANQAAGRYAESESILRATIERLEALDRATLQNADVMTFLAIARTQLGQLLRITDRPEEGQEVLTAAAQLLERLRGLFPSRPRFAALLGRVGLLRGECLLDVGRVDLAIPVLTAAEEAFETAREEAPDESEVSTLLGPTRRVLAGAHARAGDSAGAQATFERARETLEAAVEEHPEQPFAAAELGELWLLAARNSVFAAPTESTQGCARRAFEFACRAIEIAPRIPDFVDLACEAASVRIEALLASGDPADRAIAAEQLEELERERLVELARIADCRAFGFLMKDETFLALLADVAAN